MIRHAYLRNQDLVTVYGKVHFDEKGVAKDAPAELEKNVGTYRDLEAVSSSPAKEPVKKAVKAPIAKKPVATKAVSKKAAKKGTAK